MGLNNTAWQKLCAKYDILRQVEQHGQFVVTDEQISEFRDPSLMTNFDHRNGIPTILAEHGLSILPISGSEYVLGHFSAYQSFEPTLAGPLAEATQVTLPAEEHRFRPEQLIDKGKILECAQACGILDKFLDGTQGSLTLNASKESGNFGFDIDTVTGLKHLEVDKVKVAVDGVYETSDSVVLFNVKKWESADFWIEQLYYPMRVWQVLTSKQVKVVELVFTNGVFSLYEYQFDELENYNSLRLLKQQHFTLYVPITVSDVESIMDDASYAPKTSEELPKADNVSYIISLVEQVFADQLVQENHMEALDLSAPRRKAYVDAACYLGLIELVEHEDDGTVEFVLTELGTKVIKSSWEDRTSLYAEQILKNKSCYAVMRSYLQQNRLPDNQDVIKLMHDNEPDLPDSLVEQRSYTVLSWVMWIIGRMQA